MGQANADAALVHALTELESPRPVRDFSIVGVRDTVPGAVRAPVARVAGWPEPVQRSVGRWLYRGFDLVHRLDLRLPPAPAPEVLTVYDLAPLLFDDEGSLPASALAAVRRAAAVICPSKFSAEALSRWAGRVDVDVIGLGTDPACFSAQPPDAAERQRLGLPERWVLHAGGATRRKNLVLLAAAWPMVRAAHPDLELLLCGPADPRRHEHFANLPGTRLMGRLSRPELLSLMAGAAAVAVPSLYEGYGLPLQEAMALRVPAVGIAAASLPEVAGPSTQLVPDSAEALAEGILAAVAGVDAASLEAGRAQARERSWDSTARQHLAVYERVLADSPRRRP